MVRVERLRFAYTDGDFTLLSHDFSAARGETIAIIGPSGSGKSTFLNLLAGVLTAQAGQLTVAGTEVSALGDRQARAFRAQHVGFVFQDFGLLDYLSAHDNILHLYRLSSSLDLTADVRARAQMLAKRVGVDHLLSRRPAALSQGERQRVAICRALLPNPGLILADEATGNLDPTNKQRILDLLFDEVQSEGATLIAVTHDYEVLHRFSRVIDFSAITGTVA